MWIFWSCLEFLGPDVGICHNSMGLGRQMVEELDQKLTLGMAERQKTESPLDEESWGGQGQWFKSQSDPSLRVWLFLV